MKLKNVCRRAGSNGDEDHLLCTGADSLIVASPMISSVCNDVSSFVTERQRQALFPRSVRGVRGGGDTRCSQYSCSQRAV